MTADVMNTPATADCSFVAGLGACAEKWRMAVCVKELATAPLTLMIATVVWRAQERLSTRDSVGNDPERRPGLG